MRGIFVDASGWIAIANKSDEWHFIAVKEYDSLFDEGANFITTSLAMIEFGNGLAAVEKRHLALALFERIKKSERIEVINISEDLDSRGWEMYKNRPDKEWGVTDCISFVVMQDRGLLEALTADHHFEQAGLQILLKKEL